MTDRYKKDKRIDGHPLRDTETGHLVIDDVVMALLNVQDEDCKHKAEQIAELKEALVFEQEASTEKGERIKMLEIEVRNNQRLYRP